MNTPTLSLASSTLFTCCFILPKQFFSQICILYFVINRYLTSQICFKHSISRPFAQALSPLPFFYLMRFLVLSHHFLINLCFSQLQIHLYLAQSLRFIILTQPCKYLYFHDFSPMIVLVSQNLNFEKRLPSPFSVP